MLHAFRNLALNFLWNEFESPKTPDVDLFQWFEEKRESAPSTMFCYLVEDMEKVEHYYILSADKDDPSVSILECREMRPEDKKKLPFVKPTGAQSGAVGPVIKRTFDPKKGAGPSLKIQGTTLKDFAALAGAGMPHSPYFQKVLDTFHRPQLKQGLSIWGKEKGPNAYAIAIEVIDGKKTVILAFQDENGLLPGESEEYLHYLRDCMAKVKYSTLKASEEKEKRCAGCGRENITVYPNALKGAGLNISNVDRRGVFPSIKESNAWKRYSLCLDCADLLYIYKNHVAKSFQTDIAGSKALVVPCLNGIAAHDFFEKIKKLVQKEAQGKENEIVMSEKQILHKVKDERAVTSLDILWAKFGQNIEEVEGIVTDILPSRLSQLARINDEFMDCNSPIFPRHPLIEKYSLELGFLRDIFKRPGGRKAKSSNESKLLFRLRREMAETIYHKESRLPDRFWDEIWTTARWYLQDIEKAESAYGLVYEGFSVKKNKAYWTMAGWIRHLAQFLYYLTRVEVLKMPENLYQPQCGLLKPYFGQESGIDSMGKAFAFVLGLLYGRLLQIQGGKGVNVSANALTWLKRLNLTGADLPDFYNKVREKLLAYEAEKSPEIREVIAELGQIGVKIGSRIELDQTDTCYFLLLGQSLATSVFPKKQKE